MTFEQFGDVRIDGIAEAVRMLEQLEWTARRRVVTSAVRAGNRELLKTTKDEAPSNTGQLRSQIRQSINLDRRTGTVTGTIKAKRTKAQGKKGQGKRGRVLHLVVGGTAPHEIRPKGRAIVIDGKPYARAKHPGAQANPFMDRAFRRGHSAALRAFERAFAEKMNQEIQKQGSTQR